MENPTKIHDLGGFPIFLETPMQQISDFSGNILQGKALQLFSIC